MKAALLPLLLPAALLGSGCSVTKTHFDYDREFDFASLRTYAWEPKPDDAPRAPTTVTDPVKDQVVAAVERELASKGFSQVPEGSDFIVAVRIDREVKEQSVDWGAVDEVNLWWETDVETYTYEEGSLMLTMVGGTSQQPIWHGSARRVLDLSARPDKVTRLINQVVAKLLQKFPPQK